MAKITPHQSYMSLPLFRHKDFIAMARDKLKGVKFDTFVGRGVSGTIAAPILARAMRKNFLIVRKPGDGSHSSNLAEGSLGDGWVFVDDLICSGDTIRATAAAVGSLCFMHSHTTEFVGALLYDGSGGFRAAAEIPWVLP